MSPARGHFMRRMRHARAAKLAGQIFHKSAPVVVVEPILQIMETRKIFAGANAAAVTVDLDIMQEIFRGPVFLGLVKHSRECKRRFEERPAIEPAKIYRR